MAQLLPIVAKAVKVIPGYPDPWGSILGALIEREGGFVHNPLDAGGATCWGVTLATLENYVGGECTPAMVAALTREEAAAIYWVKWVQHPSCRYDLILPGAGFVETLFDTAVLFGRARANKWAQEAVNQLRSSNPILVDGVLGPTSRTAIHGCNAHRLRRSLVASRILRHADRVAANSSQAVFIRGWVARALSFLEVP